MLTSFIARTVRFSMRHAVSVIFVALLLTIASIAYVATHFAINTDVSGLVDDTSPWATRNKTINSAFPQRADTTLAVIEAPTIEFADQAARELAAQLAQNQKAFSAVSQPGGGEFFDHNGLLFLPPDQLGKLAGQLTDSRPLLNRLAQDPSLRGLANLLSVTLLTPLASGQIKLGDMAHLFDQSTAALDAAIANHPAGLSWRALVVPDTLARSFVQVQPLLDFRALEAGAASSEQIRLTASTLHLLERYGASVHLTGPRPLADEEFASVREGAVPNAIATLLTVLLILWLAVRSGKMMLAVFITLLAGLAITAALGLLMVGALNLISVAFAVLFVGIGVDFGIQFAVRYRDERHRHDNLENAMAGAARSIALPLSLAAAATAASFFSFLPTAYRGVSELGLIAGVGILFVAFPSSLTLLPALIKVLKPGGEAAAPGFKWLAPMDRFTVRYRKPLLFITLALIVSGLPLLTHLRFDFNPLHLKDRNTESMATLIKLADSPQSAVNNVHVLAPTLDDANLDADRLRRVPEVGSVVTLSTFIPADQTPKLTTIKTLATLLLPILDQTPAAPANDATRVAALKNAAGALENAAVDYPDAGAAEATRLAASLRKLAAADSATRDRAERAISAPLKLALTSLRMLLGAQPINAATLPVDLKAQWVTADGRALLDISPKIPPHVDPNDDAMLRAFSTAVLRADPNAIGGPISILFSADTIVHAFIQAGAWALLTITALLWISLRNLADVLRTLIPLLVSAAVTLELSVLIGLPLNFANIIALPLLLGIGVAFKIYYVLAWRNGATNLLQSSLTQAVMLSAATTATAFGSLWLSHHPGTSSMGKLLALSLVCTLIGAVFFQPILMGRPRPRPEDAPPI
jgi:hopanoid biosynthesis associated RND transporter like protein HpnN